MIIPAARARVPGVLMFALVAPAACMSTVIDSKPVPEAVETLAAVPQFCGTYGTFQPPPPSDAAEPTAGPLGALAQVAISHRLPIQAVRVTDDGGGRAASITPAQVRQWLDYANDVHANAGIQFDFDASAGTRDFVTVASTALNSLEAEDKIGVRAAATRLGNDLSARYPGKLIVIFRFGADPRRATGQGFSGPDINFVMMPGFTATPDCDGNPNLGLLAHELGHHLGLGHTFPAVYKTQDEAEVAFWLGNFQRSAFDGDRLRDTPEDPFIIPNACDTSAGGVSLQYIGSENSLPMHFVLPRENVMSYYKPKPVFADSLSRDQAGVEQRTVARGAHLQVGARFQLVVGHTGKCLDVFGGNATTGNGAKTVQWDCLGDGNTNQQWRLVPVTDDLVQIVAVHSGKCLDVSGASTANQAMIGQWDCLGPNARQQLWRLERIDDNVVRVRSALSNKCLDVSGAGTTNGTDVWQWDCLEGNAPQQHWRVRPVDREIQVVANVSGRCLDVSGAGQNNGRDVVQYQCFGSDARQQLWRFNEVAPARYQLIAGHSGKCLDVDGAGQGDGANVWQWQCLSGPAPQQTWRLVHGRGDLFQLVAEHSTRCLDVWDAGLDDGQDVVQWNCNMQPQQLWRLQTRPRR